MADEKKGADRVVFGPPLADGGFPYLRQCEDHTLTHGVAHPVSDGKPLQPGVEVVSVEAVDGGPAYKVTPLYRTKGPTQVASDAYRSGWDEIFGSKASVGQA